MPSSNGARSAAIVTPIVGRAGSGKTTQCLTEIATALRESPTRGPRLIALLPDQGTQQFERALLANGEFKVLGRCDVLSFRRLARRILAGCTSGLPEVLTAFGRRMMLRRLISRERLQLPTFERVVEKPGFIQQVASTISELVQHAVAHETLGSTVEQAETAGHPFAASMRDVATLYQMYARELEGRFVDPDGTLDLAAGQLSSSVWLDGAEVWLDGFSGFTPQQLRFLAALVRHAESLRIALLIDHDAACLENVQTPTDPFSLFERTEQTWCLLHEMFRTAGASIQPPLRLRQRPEHRFHAAPQIGRLERSLFHVQQPKPSAPPAETSSVSPSIRIWSSENHRIEVKAVVREIRRLTVEADPPLRFRDVAVICRDLAPYHDLLSAEFRRCEIPAFIDRRRPTHHHPLVEFVRCAVRLHSQNRDSRVAIELAKTGLMSLSADELDLLENDQIEHGFPPLHRWNNLPKREDETSHDRAAVIRDRFLSDLAVWFPLPDNESSLSGADWARSLYALLQRTQVTKQLDVWIEKATDAGDMELVQEHQQVWNDLMTLLDELSIALRDEPLTAAGFGEVLEAGLADFTLGLVPPTLDQVLVASIERSRHPPVKAALVIGFNEGSFPSRPPEDPLLGDAERTFLDENGVAIGPPRHRRIRDERLLAYIAMTRASERLYISYVRSDNSSRALYESPYLEQIRIAAGPVSEERIGEDDSPLTVGTPATLAAAIAERIRTVTFSSPAASAEVPAEALARIGAIYDAARARDFMQPPLARVLAAFAAGSPDRLTNDDVERLFPQPRHGSVSRLEALAQCPFKHFAGYGLRLRPRNEHTLDALELGNLSHAILEHFFNDLIATGQTLQEMEVEQIARSLAHVRDNILPEFAAEQLIDLNEQEELRLRTDEELEPALRAQHKWTATTRPAGTEIVFGGRNAVWPALLVHSDRHGNVEIHGKIDRIDLCRTERGLGALVFDYKRSRSPQRLQLDRAYHGLSLQLLTYLLVLREYGDRLANTAVTPIGALLAPLLAAYERVDHPDEAADKVNPLRVFNPRGVLDFDWMPSIDPDVRQGESSRTFAVRLKKDGNLSHANASDAMVGSNFSLLLGHVKGRLSALVDQWLDGDIEVRPTYFARRLPCEHCDFRSVCRFELGRSPVRRLEKMTRLAVMERIQGEQS